MKKKCGGFQKWSLRYLILDKSNRILYYYHSPKDASPRRSLDLNTCTISRLTPDESPKDPGFKVTQPGVRDFIFVGSNAAVVDDWVNAIFQAKTPSTSTTQSLINGTSLGLGGGFNGGGGIMSSSGGIRSPTGGSDNFSYNGPTLAVLPNRNSAITPQGQQVPNMPQAPMPQQPRPNMPQQQQPKQQSQSARSTQSTVNGDNASGNNTTLVGAGGDTNSTLVAAQGGGGGQAKNKVAAGQPVPVLILTPDNKKFPGIERPVTGILKVGRFVGNQQQSDDIMTFKSKVISRHHAEIWAVNHEVYLRDTRSQSGTFLNAMRLSEPSKESKPYRLKPGDVIQFGVDYKGATEDNAKCISVRVDLKMKVLEPVQSMGMSQSAGSTGEKEETLVGQNSDGTTLVGGGSRAGTKTNMSEKTLVGVGQQDGTLYGNDRQAPSMPMPGMRPNGNMGMQQQQMGGMPQNINMTARMPGQGGPIGMMAPGGIVGGGMRPGMRPPQMMPGMQR